MYLGILFIVAYLQQQILSALAELSDEVLFSTGVHEIPFKVLTGRQVTTDYNIHTFTTLMTS